MYVCSCFAITEEQIAAHAESGRATPRAIAGACGAGTDCGSCVRRIQALLGRAAVPCAVHPGTERAVARPAAVRAVPAVAPAPAVEAA